MKSGKKSFSWFFKLLGQSKKMTLDIDFDDKTGTTDFWIDAKVFNKEKNPIGIVGICLSLDSALEIVRQAVPSKNSLLLLTDADNNIVMSSRGDEFGTSLKSKLPESVEKVKGFPQIKTWETADLGKMIYAERQISGMPYKIVLITPVQDFLPGIFEMIRRSILTTIVILLLTAFFISFVINKLTARISSMQHSFEGIAAGDFTLTLETKNDELGQIAVFLNQMARALQRSFLSIRNETLRMKEVGENLSENMHTTTNSVRQISLNIDGVKEQTITQAASVTETAATVEEMIDTIGRLNGTIESQAISVAKSSWQ